MLTLRKHFPNLSVSLLAYWACLLGALHVFVELAGEVYEREGFFFDAPVLSWFANHPTSWLVGAAQTFSTIGSPLILGLLAAGVALRLGSHKPRAVIFLGFSLGGAMLLNVLFKLLFARVRPALFEQLTPAPGYAFPSGHAMGSAAFFLALYLLVREFLPNWRWLAALLGALLTLGIGLSRLVSQVHYPSDVLAGWALSVAWVLGVNLWYGRVRPEFS